ncbi:MAG: DUF3592 domain-containing protein [Acidobacteria bacterium]|nr:DUF3592 domain-containing protein [Acidobacteriota bacterium]
MPRNGAPFEGTMVVAMNKSSYQVALRMMAPPRQVPLSSLLVLLLNVGVQIGFFVLAFSTPFFWLFVGNADLPAITFRGETMRTNGRVVEIEDTLASENKRRIWGVHYRYSVSARAHDGVSYETGGTDLEPGSIVIVEYLARDPSVSRIEGMRRGMFGPFVLFVLIFPIIGLIFTLAALAWGARRAMIFVRGIAVFAKFKEMRATNTQVNRRPVYEVIHEYRTLDGELCQASTKTTDVDSIADEQEELLLYDPVHPRRGVPVDNIKPLPALDEAGGFRANLPGAVLRLVLPAAVIAGNALWLLHRMG